MALLPKKVESLFGLKPVSTGVSVFGKHPAYADHLPLNLGDQAALAQRLRETFYNRGITTRVGDWETLQRAGRAIPFGHWVLYREPEGAALLRIWPSRDAVNRSDIPMVLSATTSGLSIEWLLTNGSAVLRQCEAMCKSAKTLDEISAAVRTASEELRVLASGGAPDKKHPEALAAWLTEPSFTAEIPALIAALRPIWEFLPLDDDARSNPPDRAAATRSAAWATVPLEGMARWSALLDAALAGRKIRYFLIAPDSGQWLDLLVGEPVPRQFNSLRAGLETVPTAAAKTDELSDSFGRQALAWLQKLAGGAMTLPAQD